MRKVCITLTALLVLVLPFTSQALTSDARKTLVLDKGAAIHGVYVGSGGTMDLPAHFPDDVYLAGGTVTLSGSVDGDLFIAGGTVKVNGEVKGSVRMAGGTVDLNSKVGGNVVLLGGTLSTGTQSDIAGEVLILGGTATLDGHAAKTVDAWTDVLTLNGKVDGSVNAHFSNDNSNNTAELTLGSSAVVGGDLTYFATRDVEMHTGAVVKGKVAKNAPEGISANTREQVMRAFRFVRIWNLFSLLVVAALVVLLFPKTLRNVSATMMQRRGKAAGWGALILLASPVAFFLLPFTIIGVPLMFILLALYLIALYVSQVFLGFVVGSWIMRLVMRGRSWTLSSKSAAALLPTLIGILAMSLVFDFLLGDDVLPGPLAMIINAARFVLMVWAFGGLLMEKMSYLKNHEQS